MTICWGMERNDWAQGALPVREGRGVLGFHAANPAGVARLPGTLHSHRDRKGESKAWIRQSRSATNQKVGRPKNRALGQRSGGKGFTRPGESNEDRSLRRWSAIALPVRFVKATCGGKRLDRRMGRGLTPEALPSEEKLARAQAQGPADHGLSGQVEG